MTLLSKACIYLRSWFSFYCIILLTALFTSSCYWQPVPTSALLLASLPNVTSSPLLYFPNSSVSDENAIQASQLIPVPKLTTLSDRCWCDLSGGHLFDPYNMTLWQLTSLSRTLGATKSPRVLIAQDVQLPSNSFHGQSGEPSETKQTAKVWVLRMTGNGGLQSEEERKGEDGLGSQPHSSTSVLGHWRWPLSFLSSIQPFSFFLFNGGYPLSDVPENFSTVTQATKVETAMETAQPTTMRRTYDLRRHGINLVVDLGWGRRYT